MHWWFFPNKLATFNKNDWSEVTNPASRNVVEKSFKDVAADNVVSSKDLASMKSFSPLAMTFTVINLIDETMPIVKASPEKDHSEILKQIQDLMDSRVKLRNQLLDF